MKRLALSLFLAGLLLPASASAMQVKTEWVRIMPSMEFTIKCESEYIPERCAEWELEVGSDFYYHYPVTPGSRSNSRIGRFSNPKAGEIEVPYDCDLTGSVTWTVNATSNLGVAETASGDAYFPFYSTLCIDPYKIHRPISRRQAEGAVLERLRAFYVSRLRCHRAGRGFKCDTIYSNSFRACRSLFRVDKYFEHSYGGDRTYIQAYPVRKRCVTF